MSATPIVRQLQRGASHPLFPGAAIAAVAVAILAGAYAFEYLGGLKPCPLCLEQRVPWFILIGLGGAIVGAHTAVAPRLVLAGLYIAAALVAAWSAYLGLYHAGIEYGWWDGPPTCTASGLPQEGKLLQPGSNADVALCNEVQWALMGVSLAGFNFLFSAGVVALSIWGGWRSR